MINSNQHIHFIAIGGSAMHNLAIALSQSGYQVTGSDDDIYEPSRSRLAEHGLLPNHTGWYPEKITKDTRAVILGMHARGDNPELKQATDLGIRIYSFPDFVYESSKHAKRIVIAGSHGKTTITSMIMHVLKHYNRDFDYLVGAGIQGFSNMVKLENAPVVILEGDEYLTSVLDKTPKFLRYNHTIGLISGIAWDHINAFPSRNSYIEQFEKFIDNTPENGALIYFQEDELLDRLVESKKHVINTIPYRTPDYTVKDGRYYYNTADGTNGLRLFGRHNMQNLAGAIQVLKFLDLEEKEILQAMESFEGASNRLEKVYQDKNFIVYKDFAHSPSKLQSTSAAVHELYPDKNIVSCFELHTYSSLNKDFLSEYKGCLSKTGTKIIFVNDHTLKIKKMPPLSDQIIKERFGDDELTVIRSKEALENLLKKNIQPNTVYLFMSSGNFDGLDYLEFAKNLPKNYPD